MQRTTLTLLLPLALALGCSSPGSAKQPAEPAPPKPAPSEPTPPAPVPAAADAATASGAARAEAPLASPSSPARGAEGQGEQRPYVAELAALAPHELCGEAALARARAAFLALSEAERREVLDYFQLECSNLGTFQMQLVGWVLANQDVDPASWPLLQPLEWFDPQVHAPAQPIPRRPLRADAPEVVAVRNAILGAFPPRRVEPGWMYDWAARGLVRLPAQDDALRVFENGLAGMPPNWDLAEALVERALDDGSQQKALAAFAHAYTDRVGGVYPGVTLYDAHASRSVLEMPDVDCLGLVHEIAGDWSTWKAVISVQEQQPLYAKVGELFSEAHHHRGLRTALARCFLAGSPVLRDGYQGHLDAFHGLWEKHASTPANVQRALPAPAAWADFLQGWHDELVADQPLANRGLARRAALDQGSLRVREALFYVLAQYGAYARIETPPAFDR